MSDKTGIKLDTKDKAVIAFQSALSAIPYVGGSLSHFIFGPLAELRLKRIEQTLIELAELVDEENRHKVATEQFANLLESVAPDLSRATNEEKRLRFRDLLINATKKTTDSTKWDEAHLAADLLKEIDAPGLAIIAGLNIYGREKHVTITSQPTPRIIGEKENTLDGKHYEIPYEWPVVDYWLRALRGKRIVMYSSHGKGPSYGGVILMELGRFIVDWSVKNDR